MVLPQENRDVIGKRDNDMLSEESKFRGNPMHQPSPTQQATAAL